jgi:ankyrin repeat protein
MHQTPHTAQYGQISVVSKLVEFGADANAVEESGQTPLHMASRGGFSDVIDVLIAGGADANKASKSGRRASSLNFASMKQATK